MSDRPDSSVEPEKFDCPGCGAQFDFDPGSGAMKCPYCGFAKTIPKSIDEVEELSYQAHLEAAAQREDAVDELTVTCSSCGAQSTFEPDVTASECPFCGTNIVSTERSTKVIKPKAILPFKVSRKQASIAFKQRLGRLWFAPNRLKKLARRDVPIHGVYIPYWSYDCRATTCYTGQRGEDYTVQETTYVMENGRRVARTRSVQKTRWYPAQGCVFDSFDDVMVLASRSLPAAYVERLEPWDLEALVAYRDDFLSGFRTESYQVSLEQGFERARSIMERQIVATIHRDIGGDRQRIHEMRTQHDDITFKHLLLPVWISAYKYRDKVYRFLVNGRTGEVQCERPYSWVKIALAALGAAALIGIIVAAARYA